MPKFQFPMVVCTITVKARNKYLSENIHSSLGVFRDNKLPPRPSRRQLAPAVTYNYPLHCHFSHYYAYTPI